MMISWLCQARRVFAAAIGAKSLEHIVYGINLEILGNAHRRHCDILKAEGAPAFAAIEMDMHVVLRMMMVMAVAEFIFGHSASILNGVDDAVLVEKGKHAGDAGFVESVEFGLQIGKAHRRTAFGKCAGHEHPVGCGGHAGLLEH